MIKANELRIGNLVYFENPHSDRVKIKLSINDFKNFTTNGCFSNFEPIPLTSKILKSLNFECESEILDVYFYDRFKFFYNQTYKFWKVSTIEKNSYITKIEFVHELQNFIFSVDCVELVFSTEP